MSHDPLAGLLPDHDPLKPFDAPPTKEDSAERLSDDDLEMLLDESSAPESEILPGLEPAEEPTVFLAAEDSPAAAISAVPAFPQDRTTSRGRSTGRGSRYSAPRRRSRNAPLILGLGALMCAGIGVCGYLLFSGFGISQDGSLVARAELEAEAEAEAKAERERAEAEQAAGAGAAEANQPTPAQPRRRDPVMGGLLPEPGAAPRGGGLDPIANRTPAADPEPRTPQPIRPETPMTAAPANDRPPANAPPKRAMENPPPANAEMEAAPPTEPPPTEPPMTEPPMTAEQPPAAGTANPAPDSPASGDLSPLEPAMATLRSGEWAEMMAAAEQAQQVAKTPEQRELAAGMALLAELAEYYVEGIRRGADGLGPAETFEIVPEMQVVVVESSRDHIVLKVNGRVKRYPFESMPLVLAHRLTAFSLPKEDPVARAAAGAYQALWPQSTDAHRRQAFEWWKNLEGDAGEAEFSQLEPTVRELFQMPNS